MTLHGNENVCRSKTRVFLGFAVAAGTNALDNWSDIQTNLMVAVSFRYGCKVRIYSRRRSGVLYSGPDTSIGSTLYGVRDKKWFQSTRKPLFISWTETSGINPAMALTMQLLLVHDLNGAVGNCAMRIAMHHCFQATVETRYRKGKKWLRRREHIRSNFKENFRRIMRRSTPRGPCGFRFYALSKVRVRSESLNCMKFWPDSCSQIRRPKKSLIRERARVNSCAVKHIFR